jgi:hypothetical protein
MANIAGFAPLTLCAWSNTGVDCNLTKHSAVRLRSSRPALSRYHGTGLIWLLGGGEVIALTQHTAVIQWPSDSASVYRKSSMPALGLMGAQ